MHFIIECAQNTITSSMQHAQQNNVWQSEMLLIAKSYSKALETFFVPLRLQCATNVYRISNAEILQKSINYVTKEKKNQCFIKNIHNCY